jgi:pyridoxal phosphate enzyme (YggS family)
VAAKPPRYSVAELDPVRVRANLASVRERIAAACTRAGRDASAVDVLAATKYVPSDQMGALAEAGVELVGENIAQDLVAKHERWRDRLEFDFIGHLQSRKTKLVLPRVRLIHGVDSESVLRQIEQHAQEPARVLIEVNVAGEESKQGVAPDEVDRFVEAAAAYPKARFAGLMTMPPLAADCELTRPHFAALRELADRLRRDWAPEHEFSLLSMGTSQDYEVAVEEGATVVRLGTVLYA